MDFEIASMYTPVYDELLNWVNSQMFARVLIRCQDARCRHSFRSFDRHRRPASTTGRSAFRRCRVGARQTSTPDPHLHHLLAKRKYQMLFSTKRGREGCQILPDLGPHPGQLFPTPAAVFRTLHIVSTHEVEPDKSSYPSSKNETGEPKDRLAGAARYRGRFNVEL